MSHGSQDFSILQDKARSRPTAPTLPSLHVMSLSISVEGDSPMVLARRVTQGCPLWAFTLSPGCSSVSFPGTFLTIFTRWALPVVAAGAECHGTLIWDFWVWLIRSIIPPGSVMRWHHVIMNLLTEHRHC